MSTTVRVVTTAPVGGVGMSVVRAEGRGTKGLSVQTTLLLSDLLAALPIFLACISLQCLAGQVVKKGGLLIVCTAESWSFLGFGFG